MYNYGNIEEFKDFVANASKEQIERVIYFINMISFLEGIRNFSYDERQLISKAIEFAKSDYDYVEDFIIARDGIIL